MAQVLINSCMCAEGLRPVCQDTGIVNVFLKAGMDVRLESDTGIDAVVDTAVRQACCAYLQGIRD
jgi:fumarate hydratase class I